MVWTPAKEGFYFPQAFVSVPGRSEPVLVRGNPVRVLTHEPAIKTYWGELHSHSSISADGLGNDPYTYARDPARLDFFASTEHADDDGNPRANAIRPEDWETIKGRVRRFYDPGRFVTILAYECSFEAPSGHHNVFFRGTDGEPWPVALMGSVQNLWAKIRVGDAITIPHHMGIQFGGVTVEQQAAGPGLQPIVTTRVAARHQCRQLRRLVDSRSASASAAGDVTPCTGRRRSTIRPTPSPCENARFTGARSVPGAHYARDAWAAGLEPRRRRRDRQPFVAAGTAAGRRGRRSRSAAHARGDLRRACRQAHLRDDGTADLHGSDDRRRADGRDGEGAQAGVRQRDDRRAVRHCVCRNRPPLRCHEGVRRGGSLGKRRPPAPGRPSPTRPTALE